jgi:hypothetical protein
MTYDEVWKYDGLFKIFRTDAVKIIKLTQKPIGHHHPRSNFLSHVDTGPTVSSIFKRFMEVILYQIAKHSLRLGLDLLSGIKPASSQLQFHFFK